MLDVTLFFTAIATVVAFAGIRADVFRREIVDGAAVVFDAFAGSLPAPDNTSEHITDLLGWAWISATLGFELACGLCWSDFAASRSHDNRGLLQRLEKQLLAIEEELLAVETAIQEFLSEPSDTYEKCWADFRQGISDAISRIDEAA